ncbi:hypothetical protein TWF481_010434 [Arthrobotrys musiformis]|uniref:Ubiquitin 3 binding protein But2 C-terminal domain-containing protein n=1 Tax=Arthrobotrys musiformis TaxID=47236 RepID=A0AAV9W2Y3_9PEZI
MKYAISLIGLLAVSGAQADSCPENNCVRAVIAERFPTRPTASDCSSFLSATTTPVVSKTLWIKRRTKTTLAAVTSTTILPLGVPTPELPTIGSSISYPYANNGGGNKRRSPGNMKRDDLQPPIPIPNWWWPPNAPVITVVTETPTSLPAYAVTACVEFTSLGTVRSPASRFSHACSCRGFTTAVTEAPTSTRKTKYTVTTAITTYTPTSWVVAYSFKLKITSAFTGGTYVVTAPTQSPGPDPTILLRPTGVVESEAAICTLHPDRKPKFATPPDLLVPVSPADPTGQDLRRVTCNGGIVVGKVSQNGGSQRFLRILPSELSPETLPTGHYPLLCKVTWPDNTFTCQGEGDTAPVVDLGIITPGDPLLRIFQDNFAYPGPNTYLKKQDFKLTAIPIV